MLYVKHPTTGDVFAYETESERAVFGPPDLIAMTDAEVDAHINRPPEIFVPQSVTRFQARAALHLAGLLEQVEAMIADPSTPVLAKLAWRDAQEFKRTSPTIAAMSSALGLTEQQLDDLFTVAAGIDA